MPFSIRLLPTTERGGDGERLGEIQVGVFTEQFGVYPFAGSVELIAIRWHDKLRELVEGARAVGLPAASNMAWVLFSQSHNVLVQQFLLLHPPVGPKLTASGIVTNIPEYSEWSEEGDRISEWATSIDDIRKFLDS